MTDAEQLPEPLISQESCRQVIRECRAQIDRAHQRINDLAKSRIDDFHFLNYQVSTFWTCDDSPVGFCVFALDEYCKPTHCRYCNGPVERK